jgi:polyisoprenyl-teichoic acid--peptidoglycan teichoic acid transferase
VARRPRTILLTLIGPPLCGVLLGCLVIGAWVATGLPTPAKGDTWFRIMKVPPMGVASYTTGQPDQVQFFLAVGNDSRDPNGVGLGDAIHVIAVNPQARAGTIIDIPRDTSVGGGGKINGVLANGGLARFTETISGFVGVPIRFAITTNFAGFIDMVNEFGGIDVNITQPMHDQNSGTDFDPGPNHLNGEGALAFSRDRYSFSAGDVSRTENQGFLLITALQNIQQRNPGAAGILNLLGNLGRHVQMENVSFVDLYRLGRLALAIDPANIKNVVIPTGGGAGTNLAPGPGIDSLFADFRDDGVLQSH